MAGCNHQNGSLFEFTEAAHVRDVIDGRMQQIGINEIGQIMHYEYRCDDCGKCWRYRATPTRPAWLRRIHEQLAITPTGHVDWRNA